MPRMFRAWSSTSLPLVFSTVGALGACSAENALPPDAGAPDLAAPVDARAPELPGCRPSATLNLPLPLFELRATAPLPIEVQLTDPAGAAAPHPVRILLTRADGSKLVTLVDAEKPLGTLALRFTPAEYKDLPTGALRLQADIGCPAGTAGAPARATATVYAVRLGATGIVVKDGEGGGRVPLMYHALDHRDANYFPIPETMPASSLAIPEGEPELDAPDGTPRLFPEKPWADLATPPLDDAGAASASGHTIPVSLRLGTRPDLVFRIGRTARGAAGPQPSGLDAPGLPPIRLVVDGVKGSDDARIQEGGTATVRLASSPVPAINRVDENVTWHFEVKSASGSYERIPGAEQSATLRFYGVLGNDQGSAAPDLPWVAVVDAVTSRIAGAATDAAGARTILVQHVYEELGLTYDRKSGASHYTRYAGGGWTNATFSLAEFLNRSRGKVVNCSDCASILSTYANMIGAKLHYAIIGWNFKLNPILGIGAMSFGSPFDSGRLSFSYHAVTTPDEAMTIDDSTLAVDGDSAPATSPYSRKLVQDLTGEDYLTRLSPTFGTGTPIYQYKDELTHAR